MRFTDELFQANHQLWQSYLSCPFVQEMAQGVLPIEKFRHYMLQDYLYLKEYVKVFALGLCHSQDEVDLRLFADSCQAVVAEIDRVHKPYMKRIGISDAEVESAQASLDNVAYTAYMIQAASLGDQLDALIAILSCSWSYAWIAREMLKQYPQADQDEFYGEWFEGYLSEEYQVANEALLVRVDELCAELNAPRKAELMTLFKNCSEFEARFWTMAYELR